MKINPQVYLNAAELVAKKRLQFACAACCACGGSSAESLFADYFKPDHLSNPAPWFGFFDTDEARNERILALCFMHQIAKDL